MAAVTRPYFFRFPFALPLVGGSTREPALHVLCTADSIHILSYLPRQRVIILIFCDSFCYPIPKQNKFILNVHSHNFQRKDLKVIWPLLYLA